MQIRGMGCCVMVEEIALILFIFQERTEADRIDSRYSVNYLPELAVRH